MEANIFPMILNMTNLPDNLRDKPAPIQNNNSFLIAIFIITCISVIADMIISSLLQTTNNIIKLARIMILSEAFMYYSYGVIFFSALFFSNVKGMFDIFLEFNIFTAFSDPEKVKNNMLVYNVALLLGSFMFNLISHCFIFLEIIMIMRYPMGNEKLRYRIYFSVCIVSAIITFIVSYSTSHPCFDMFCIAKDHEVITKILFSIYVLSMLLAFINLFFSIRRLGCKNIFKLGYYDKFLLQEIIMTLAYFCLVSPYIILCLLISIQGKSPFSPVIDQICCISFLSLGTIQFFSRLLETNSYSSLKENIQYYVCCKRVKKSSNKELEKECSLENIPESVRNYLFR